MRQFRAFLFFLLLFRLFPIEAVKAQNGPTALQPGVPIERTIARGQTHSFSITLEEDLVLQLVVDQRGIDVLVRVFDPSGKSLGEFDSPNGSEGPENVSVTAVTSGVYRIDVTPLEQYENVPPGRYEIRIVELRHATEQELQASKNHDVLKAKGLALLDEVAETLQEVRLPQTRVRTQLQAANLLWSTDEKRAGKFVADALDGIKDFMNSVDLGDEDYYRNYQMAMQLRHQVIQIVAPHDPEMALNFLRSTRTLVNPEEGQNPGHSNPEAQLELSLAGQLAARDPKRAFQIAEDSLKKEYSATLVETVARLRSTDPDLAAKLAKEIAAKLEGEKLLKNPAAAMLAVNLLRIARPQARGNPRSATPLLSDDEYRDLFEKTLSDGLSYTKPASTDSAERNSAQNILNSLKPMTAELEGYAPGSIAAVEKRTTELNTPSDPQAALWQKYSTTINNGSLDAAVEAADQAPREMRDALYQQLANRAGASGDFTRARQLLLDHIRNPLQRRQALANLDQQAIRIAVARGKIEEALRLISNFPSSRERVRMIGEIVNQIGPGQKRAMALTFLEQARGMLGASGPGSGQDQMNALFDIARAFSRYDGKRGFEIIEPLVAQFNEISGAAVLLSGFGLDCCQDGELLMENGSGVVNTANRLDQALGALATANFERAKAAADMIHPAEVRLSAYLAIATEVIQGSK